MSYCTVAHELSYVCNLAKSMPSVQKTVCGVPSGIRGVEGCRLKWLQNRPRSHVRLHTRLHISYYMYVYTYTWYRGASILRARGLRFFLACRASRVNRLVTGKIYTRPIPLPPEPGLKSGK